MKIYIKTITCLVLFFSFNACKEEKKTQKMDNKTLDSIYQKSIEFKDSLNSYWKLIHKSDSQKLADIKTLLYQISLTKAPDLSKIEQGNMKLKQVSALKYGQNEIGDNAKVDLFDNTCDSLIAFVSELKSKTPYEENYPLLEDILNDIRTNNSLDLAVRLRAHYNKWAEKYNESIDELSKFQYPAAAHMKKIDIYGYAE
ncbi:MAG: hypothetical protein SNJ77_12385, partial [Cytophagales bacterium]